MKKKVKKKESEEFFFVHLSENEKIRRDILETIKYILEYLQGYERIRSIRHQKIGQINNMGQSLKEINKLVSELKQKFPADIKLPKLKEEKLNERYEKSKPHVKRISELDRLSSELKAVEEKLNRLG